MRPARPDAHLLPTPRTPTQRTAWAQAGATVFKQVVALDSAALGFYALFAARFATAGWGSQLCLAFAPLAFLVSLIAGFMIWMKLILADPADGEEMRLSRIDIGLVLASPIGFLLGMMALVFPAWSQFAGVLLP